MPDPKKYISVLNNGIEDLYIKDAEARQDIEDIKSSITGAMHWAGFTTTQLSDGATTNPIIIDGDSYTAKAGDVVAYGELEFVWSGSKWQEYGSTGSLKALAFKDSATGEVTASGTNAPSAVTFTGGSDADFVTGFNDDAVAPSFSEGAFTPAQIQAGFVTAGTAASFSEGAFTPAEIQAGFVTPGVAATFTEGAFAPGSLPSMTYDQANEKLTFAAGTLPSKAADTFNGGSPTAIDTTKFSGGSKAADTFDGGTPTAIDTSKFDGGSKAADSFSAGSAATPTTAKAITAIGTGEAAAQVFSGSAVSVTVS
jgi:hypothetical protein